MTQFDRRRLPIAPTRTTVTARETIQQQTEPFVADLAVRAPDGAPNVLLILLDDMGFGASSAFGGPCRMPVSEKLAAGGLRYTRFHTTAICSPTRAALLSGRNHHSVGMGNLTHFATAAPGYNAVRPPSKAPLAETLRLNGYATGAFGKWHQTPDWEITPTGPFDRWPTGEGFQKFYGILSGESSQFTPTLYDGTTAIDPPATEEEGYHLSEDLIDQAQRWITDVRRNSANQPWFTYLSFGATHAPFHLPESWRGRKRGEFAHGWNAQRELTLARQKELGIVPAETELAPWTPGVPVWEELSEVEQEAAERLMEAYASFAEHTDAQIGRLVEFLRERDELDDTLIIYVLGDNGAAAEGGLVGTLNEHLVFNGLPESPERIVEYADEIGGPHTYPHYPVGWAVGMNAPFQWTKQVASHFGGTRNGLIVHWPEGLGARDEIREQFSHVIDVAPTILEAAGLPEPEVVNGITQEPLEGTSLAYSFDDGAAPDRHTTQYFEIFGNRGIYHEGWTAVTKHRTPWEIARRDGRSYAEDVWELYDTNVDWAQARDIADENPEKLAELQALFLVEAAKYNVLPLDDRVGRPGPGETARSRLASQDRVTLTPADRYVVSSRLPALTNTSFRVLVDFEADSDRTEGVLIAQGGRFGGWAIHLIDGRPVYTHNRAGLDWTDITGLLAVPAGRHALEFRFHYDGAAGVQEDWENSGWTVSELAAAGSNAPCPSPSRPTKPPTSGSIVGRR